MTDFSHILNPYNSCGSKIKKKSLALMMNVCFCKFTAVSAGTSPEIQNCSCLCALVSISSKQSDSLHFQSKSGTSAPPRSKKKK
mmetsp:Transcript_760/g.2039  ORF Transcript_760/g.2039 Transcript_760/m.2039 type:complete len:84 (-) Transcript_760:300-551(-)